MAISGSVNPKYRRQKQHHALSQKATRIVEALRLQSGGSRRGVQVHVLRGHWLVVSTEASWPSVHRPSTLPRREDLTTHLPPKLGRVAMKRVTGQLGGFCVEKHGEGGYQRTASHRETKQHGTRTRRQASRRLARERTASVPRSALTSEPRNAAGWGSRSRAGAPTGACARVTGRGGHLPGGVVQRLFVIVLACFI